MNKTVARTIQILQLLAESSSPLFMVDVWKRLNLPKSTTSDLVNSLVDLNILECNGDDANALEPGFRFFELAARFVDKNRLLPIARRHMAALVRDSGESVFLSVFDKNSLMFLEKMDAVRYLQSHYAPGELLPLHASASGKAILATQDETDVKRLVGNEPFAIFGKKCITHYAALLNDLRQIRKRKYSIENKEKNDYLVATGAPIRRSDGTPVAAISIAMLSEQAPDARISEVGPLVYATAFRVSRYLGYSEPDLFALVQ